MNNNTSSNNNKYTAVNCFTYDWLEIHAIRKHKLLLCFLENNDTREEEVIIKTLETKNKEEFLLTTEGLRIRLDHIVSFSVVT